MSEKLWSKDFDGLEVSVTKESDEAILIVVRHDIKTDRKGDWGLHSLEVKEQRSKLRYRWHQ